MINSFNYINWTVSPVIVSIGSFQLRWYGLLLAIGFYLAYLTLQKIFKKENLSQQLLDRLAIWSIVWTFVGLRLGHFLFYDFEFFVKYPLQVLLPFDEEWNFVGYQGLASHGAVISLIIFLSYFAWKHKMKPLWLLDRLSVVIPIAASFVRIGNLMNHEIVGSITDVPWAFNFTHGGFGVAGTYRHPAQIYESLVYLILFLFMIWYYFKHTKGKMRAGSTTGILLVVIFTARFIIEFFKEVQVAKETEMSLLIGQWLSIPFILIGIALLIYSALKKEIPVYTEPKKEVK
ncbi:MAG TPA: prolipoprotein diacylglyceryl transferase [Bacteroidales bacterium]|nr:prolipoprotein diacylglyceryl transferase [Bacteroidales bacterium]HOH22090.1 prolipoprotein diacylglyceryl transferase [Bacteroidales bacterium]HPB57052.1 prolipoprotein diacylglyceryl transferase [Bacteroidales bacterium]HPZ03449.1 prolipoprotein diacylglyceryl transferase [Bacteroidales bacterium]HQB74772.1 prolipoprotein diacylglyceryl transferase [Bacteroidales bacterium]